MNIDTSPAIRKTEMPLPQRIIESDASDFRKKFNQVPFQFSHNLAENPLFEIPRLVELAKTLIQMGRQNYVVCMTSEGLASRTFAEAIQEKSACEAIADIAESGSLVFLKSVHVNPEYKVLLNQVFTELEELTGLPLHQKITQLVATIIISSPNSVTPYHIDHDCNFLFQINGDKKVHLFDQNDRSVLTKREIEAYYAGVGDPIYRQENQSKAQIFHLISGTGVHHPVLAPHWVKNGNNISISLSINFCLKEFDSRAKGYKINHYLRKIKLKPLLPGRSSLKDDLKISIPDFFSNHDLASHWELLFSGIKRVERLMSPIRFATKCVEQLKLYLTEKVPVVADFYHYYYCFPRQVTACRGIFRNFSEAVQALPTNSRISHSQPEIHDHPSVAWLTARRKLGELPPYDYPLLPWLRSALETSSTVFDFGGNVGISYYAFKNHLSYPSNLNWIVCELPELIKAGEKIAKEMDSHGLSFTNEFKEADRADILLTLGTLQYIEPSLTELLSQLGKKPIHLLISMVPFYDGESFITLQNVGYAFSPYKIQNRSEFINSLTSLGYELIDSWEWERTCSIPFHPELCVRAYYGFYFQINPR